MPQMCFFLFFLYVSVSLLTCTWRQTRSPQTVVVARRDRSPHPPPPFLRECVLRKHKQTIPIAQKIPLPTGVHRLRVIFLLFCKGIPKGNWQHGYSQTSPPADGRIMHSEREREKGGSWQTRRKAGRRTTARTKNSQTEKSIEQTTDARLQITTEETDVPFSSLARFVADVKQRVPTLSGIINKQRETQ